MSDEYGSEQKVHFIFRYRLVWCSRYWRKVSVDEIDESLKLLGEEQKAV